MNIARPLIGLGIDFVPVPGLALAFDTLGAIWDSVQKASGNRDALRNLAQCAAEILVAVDRVLGRRDAFDAHVRALLRGLEGVLEDFRVFAEKHASMHLFRVLVRNVDVEGEIERFQQRLQGTLMAFNIAALGAIDDRLRSGDPVRGARLGDSVRVRATFSMPHTAQLRNDRPVLWCQVFREWVALDGWGLRAAGAAVHADVAGAFRIVSGASTWRWVLVGQTMRVDEVRVGCVDGITVVFGTAAAARAWFAWLRAYARGEHAAAAPAASEVWVRQEYDCEMRRTATGIARLPPGSTRLRKPLGGTLDAPPAMHATHFEFTKRGRTVRVYRSGDTLAVDDCTAGREAGAAVTAVTAGTAGTRYRFATAEEAGRWYAAWRDCVVALPTL